MIWGVPIAEQVMNKYAITHIIPNWSVGYDCVGRFVTENTERKRVVSLKNWMNDIQVALYIIVNKRMVDRKEISL